MNARRGLVGVCLLGWATVTNYTNHAALIPVLMSELGFGATQAGLLSSAFFTTIAVAFTPGGMLSDRFGPKRVGTVGLLVIFASNVWLGVVDGFADLVLSRVVGGVGCGIAFIAGVRYVTLAFPPERVYLAQGVYGGFVQLGGGTSLSLLPWLDSLLGWRLAFVSSSCLVAATALLWVVLAPDHRAMLPRYALRDAARVPNVWRLGVAHAGTFGLSVLVGTWITTFFVHDLATPLVTAGAVGSAVLAAGVVSRPLGGVLVHYRLLPPTLVIQGCLIAGAVGLAVLSVPGRPLALAALATVGVGLALSLPYAAVMNTASALVPQAPGAAVGLVSAASLVLISLGTPAVGRLYEATGSFSMPFASLAIVCVLIVWIARGIRNAAAPAPN